MRRHPRKRKWSRISKRLLKTQELVGLEAEAPFWMRHDKIDAGADIGVFVVVVVRLDEMVGKIPTFHIFQVLIQNIMARLRIKSAASSRLRS